jgi:hypothetical protein
MERIGDGAYRCTVCGSEVKVGANETPVAVLVGQCGTFPADRPAAAAGE